MITIKDVARHSGVSVSTVSKVIHNDISISEATKNRVKESIQLLGYKPNIQARNFVQQKTNHIIFLSKKEEHVAFMNPYMFEILTGVEDYLSQKGYSLSFKSIAEEDSASSFIQDAIYQKRADGIIIHGPVVTKELTSMLISEAFPYIIVGKPAFQTQANWIDTNNYLSGQLCGNHLIKKGYRKIAFIGGTRMDNIFKQRLYGFYEAMRSSGVKISKDYIKYGQSTREDGFLFATELLDSADPPEVIICTNNFVALGVQKAILDHGLKVPEDINYICFAKYPLAYMMDPRPIIVDIDINDLGIQAARFLLERLKNTAVHIQTHSTVSAIIDNET